MTSTPLGPSHRRLRILADIVLRTAVLVGVAALAPAVSGEDDALALGLTVFVALAATAFAGGLLDGLFQRDRVRVEVVWVVVVPLVAVLESASYLWTLVTEPGAFPSLQDALASARGDLVTSLVMYALLVGPPAVFGIGLGMLVRPAPRPADVGGNAVAGRGRSPLRS